MKEKRLDIGNRLNRITAKIFVDSYQHPEQRAHRQKSPNRFNIKKIISREYFIQTVITQRDKEFKTH
jgi:hypothetical protein